MTGKSGSFAVTTSNTYISGYVTWSETYDEQTNTSVLTATLRLSRTNTGYETYGNGEFFMSINGNTKSESGVYSLTYNSNTYCVSHSVTIPHNSDGTKTTMISVEGVIYSGSPNMSLPVQSESIALTDIPRASTLLAQNGTLGQALPLTIQKASNSFTHTITYSCGGFSGTIADKTSLSQLSWSVPLTLGNNSPTARNLSCTLTLYTYSGNTLVGTKSVSVSLKIPQTSEFVPDFTLSNITVTNPVSGFTACISGFSTLRASISGISYKHGATGAGISMTTDDGQGSTTASITASARHAGKITITATVTDSRGFSTTKSKEITALQYIAPGFTTASAVRCLQDGTEDRSGTYLKVVCYYSYSQIDVNAITVAKARYRISGSQGAYADLGNISGGTTIFGGLSSTISYDIQLYIQDTLGGSDTFIAHISTAGCVFNIKNTGNGAAFGKYSERENMLDVEWDIKTNGDLYIGDNKLEKYIIAAGSSGTRYWEKYSDGTFKLWGIGLIAIASSSWTAIGSGYYCNDIGVTTIPFEVTSVDAINLTPGSTGAHIFITSSAYNSSTRVVRMAVSSFYTPTVNNGSIYFTICGKY